MTPATSTREVTSPAEGSPSHELQLPSDNDAIELVRTLVGIPSVSGSESRAVEAFAKVASDWGFQASIDDVGNGLAVRRAPHDPDSASTPRAHLVLLGHIDTVPGEIPVRVENGILHGRGSVDAKGPLAAMLVAAARADLPPDCVISVVAAVGEETPHSTGARFFARSCKPSACIVAEPSGWTGVTLGYKGRLVLHASMTQPSAHTAGPRGSAADQMHQYWTSILGAIDKFNGERCGAFDTIQASIRSLGTQHDGMQEVVALSAGFRLPQWITPQVHEAALYGLAAPFSGLSLTFEGHEACHASDRNDPVARALSNSIRALGQRPRPLLKTGTADLNVVAPIWNCPIAAYGPGDSSLDHTPDEHLSLDEYRNSIRVLAHAIHALLGELACQGSPAPLFMDSAIGQPP